MKGKSKLFLMLSIVGPGIIAASAGNNAGSIITYSVAGANYGYSMFLGIIAIAVGFAVIQEMTARMAVVTGKGLSDLIRERFGAKWAFFAMFVLLVANFGVCTANFAGIAASLELFNVNKYFSIPLAVVVVWFLMTKGDYYSKAKKVFFTLTFAFFAYFLSAIFLKPDLGNMFTGVVKPEIILNKEYFLILTAMAGTALAPFIHFYIQSSIVDKEISIKEYVYEKLDVYIGAAFAGITALLIMVCTAETFFKSGTAINFVKDAALALKPFAGDYSSILFAAGLLGASLIVCCVVPLTTAYAVCEALGFESGVNNKIKEAPVFFGLFLFTLIGGAVITLIPNISFVGTILFAQQVAGFLCPVILIFMIKIVNDQEVMGIHTNTFIQNVFAKGTVVLIIALIAGVGINSI